MAEIKVEKKSNPWPWIIGLIVLALAIWAVVEMMDNDVDDAAYVGNDTAVVATNDADMIDNDLDNDGMDDALNSAAADPDLGDMVDANRVYFPLDQAELTDSARSTLDRIANEVRTVPDHEIVLTGYTDTTGPRPYNEALSERRAEAVRQYLVSQGVAADRIEVQAEGQTDLRVETDDGVREEDNRRVTIHFGDEI